MASFDQRERWHAIDRTWQHPTELVIESVTAALPTLLPFGAREQEFYRFLRDIENWGTRNDKLQLLKDDKKGQLKCTTDCFLTPSEWLCCIEKETVLSVDHRLTIGWPSVDQIANSFGQLSCWRLAWKQLQVDFAPVTLRRSVKIREGWGQPMSTSYLIYLIYCDILWYTVIYWPGKSPCNLSDLSLLILESEGLDVLDYTMQKCSTDIPQPVQDRLYHNVANCGKYKD